MVLDHQHVQMITVLDIRIDGLDGFRAAPLDHLALDRQGEGRALAQTRGHGDVAAHDVRHALGDGQTQACAAELARRGVIDLGKGLEKAFQIVARNARPAVLDRELEADPPIRNPPTAHSVADLALVSELDRVRQQILHHLADPQRIAAHDRRQFTLKGRHQSQPLGFGLGLERPGDPAMQVVHLHIDHIETHLAGFDLGHVEDVVQQAQQIVARVADNRQIFALGPFQPGRAQQLRRAQHPVHRRAQFMRNDPKEAGLGLVGRVRLVARRLQFLDQMGLMILEGANAILAQHRHGHQNEQTCRRKRHQGHKRPEQRPADQADGDNRRRQTIGGRNHDRLTRRTTQLGENQHIAGHQQGDGQLMSERRRRIPGQQGRHGPDRRRCGRHGGEDHAPPRADPLADALFDLPAQGARRQGGGEPEQSGDQADRRHHAHGPADDDHIAQVVGLQDRGQRLGSFARRLPVQPLDPVRPYHSLAPAFANQSGRTLG
ncbi:hypothetical protein D3C80_599970 [compost metagenome]